MHTRYCRASCLEPLASTPHVEWRSCFALPNGALPKMRRLWQAEGVSKRLLLRTVACKEAIALRKNRPTAAGNCFYAYLHVEDTHIYVCNLHATAFSTSPGIKQAAGRS